MYECVFVRARLRATDGGAHPDRAAGPQVEGEVGPAQARREGADPRRARRGDESVANVGAVTQWLM